MANQHSPTRKAATFRFDRDVLARAQARAAAEGDTLTAVLERALREYGDEALDVEYDVVDCGETNTFVRWNLTPGEAEAARRELESDPTVSAVRVVTPPPPR